MDNQTPQAQVVQPEVVPQPEAAPVEAQPQAQVDVAPAPEVPAQPEGQPEPMPEVPAETATVSPEQDFMNAYNTLCKEKGFELAFEVKPVFDGKIYDLTKVSIAYYVAKIA
jgi:hypothetical protein